MPVIPATSESETEEPLEPRMRRLWLAEIAPLHSSLGNKRETPTQKEEKQKQNKTQKNNNIALSIICQKKIYNALFYSVLEYIHQLSMLSHVK